MIEKNVASGINTTTVDSSEITKVVFERSGVVIADFFHVRNDGDSTAYASVTDSTLSADADGVMSIPSGGAVTIGKGLQLYVKGKVTIVSTSVCANPFKVGAKGGDLSNYYTKEETDNLVSTIGRKIIVDELPISDIDTKAVYYVPNGSSEEKNIYDEYVYFNGEERSKTWDRGVLIPIENLKITNTANTQYVTASISPTSGKVVFELKEADGTIVATNERTKVDGGIRWTTTGGLLVLNYNGDFFYLERDYGWNKEVFYTETIGGGWEKLGSTKVDISSKMDKDNPVGIGDLTMSGDVTATDSKSKTISLIETNEALSQFTKLLLMNMGISSVDDICAKNSGDVLFTYYGGNRTVSKTGGDLTIWGWTRQTGASWITPVVISETIEGTKYRFWNYDYQYIESSTSDKQGTFVLDGKTYYYVCYNEGSDSGSVSRGLYITNNGQGYAKIAENIVTIYNAVK